MTNLLFQYEELLLGNINSLSTQIFPESPEYAEKMAFDLIRIVVEKFLKWTPEQMYLNFDQDIVDKMKLNEIVRKINFPLEMCIDVKEKENIKRRANTKKKDGKDRNSVEKVYDYTYIAAKLYPDQLAFSFRETVIDIYKRILANQYGEIKDNDSKDLKELKKELVYDPYFRKVKESGRALFKFPKEYMTGINGLVRAGLCLQYMIMTFFAFHSIEEMYDFFADTQKAISALKKYRLYAVYSELFDSPLDFLHCSLPEDQRNDTLYNYYKFVNYYKTTDSKEELLKNYKLFVKLCKNA